MLKVKTTTQNLKLTVEQAAEVLRHGGVIIYPTDTAYGLGANALDENVIRKVYEIKGRVTGKPTHVVVRDWEMIEELCTTNAIAKKLHDNFLPGPLTIILPKKELVPNLLTANLPTLGVRIPNNSVTQLISKSVNFPYTTPSANPSGGKTPYSVDEALSQFTDEQKQLIDLVLDAGNLPPTPPSTIIDCTSLPPKILREGSVTRANIENALQIKLE